MSVEVFNPSEVKGKVLRKKDLKVGVLYKTTDEDGKLEGYDTVYTKTVNGKIIFFEEGRLNEDIGDLTDYYFVVAPEGTYVTLR